MVLTHDSQSKRSSRMVKWKIIIATITERWVRIWMMRMAYPFREWFCSPGDRDPDDEDCWILDDRDQNYGGVFQVDW